MRETGIADPSPTHLFVENGIHSGAVVIFSDQEKMTLGSSESCDVMIADSGVAAEHVAFHRSPDGQLIMQALCADVALFGFPLLPQKKIHLLPGSRFSIAGIEFYVGIESDLHNNKNAGDDHPIGFVADLTQSEQARLAYLRRYQLRQYVSTVVREKLRIHRRKGVALVMLIAMLVVIVQFAKSDQSLKRRNEFLHQIAAQFVDVKPVLDRSTGITTYTGYVDSYVELEELRVAAWRADIGQSVIKIHTMDNMKAQVSSFLETYYLAAEVRRTGPGKFDVQINGEDGMKILAAWDQQQIAGKAKELIPGLLSIEIVLDSDANRSIVRAPLSSLGMSLMGVSNNLHYVVTADGQLLFNGAQIKEGRIRRISFDSIEIVGPQNTTIFEMLN